MKTLSEFRSNKEITEGEDTQFYSDARTNHQENVDVTHHSNMAASHLATAFKCAPDSYDHHSNMRMFHGHMGSVVTRQIRKHAQENTDHPLFDAYHHHSDSYNNHMGKMEEIDSKRFHREMYGT